uniref:Thaumatin-like protein n=1 Tax=Rhabditophanes sp. KR3021 TaxID=114890 RepID=A0AC35U4H5_9BILA
MSANGSVRIQLENNCGFTIWPGIQGSTLIEDGGFELKKGHKKTIKVPNNWSGGRIWARTGCKTSNFKCDTGSCKNSIKCAGTSGASPVTMAEFLLGGAGNQDYYDVSLVDGFNVQITIEPIEGTFSLNNTDDDCIKAGQCLSDVLKNCPKELSEVNPQKEVVGCSSACAKFNTDQYCCRGSAFQKSDSCKASTWPLNYAKFFKDSCPTAYSFAFDNQKSTYSCRGVKGKISADYKINFC